MDLIFLTFYLYKGLNELNCIMQTSNMIYIELEQKVLLNDLFYINFVTFKQVI